MSRQITALAPNSPAKTRFAAASSQGRALAGRPHQPANTSTLNPAKDKERKFMETLLFAWKMPTGLFLL